MRFSSCALHLFRNPEESVGKIKNRKKRGIKNHSPQPKNSLGANAGQDFFSEIFEPIFPTDSEGVAIDHDQTTADATLSGLRLSQMTSVIPGLPKRNPGLELANAFSVSIRLNQRKHLVLTSGWLSWNNVL